MLLIDIEPGDPRLISDVLPVLNELRPKLTADSFREIYDEGHPQGLRFLAAYPEDGQCAGVAGWRIFATTTAGRKLYIDDLVTADAHRSKGIGAALLSELAARAKAAGCPILDLDSGTWRKDAHRFYMREGLPITAFHFTLDLTDRVLGELTTHE